MADRTGTITAALVGTIDIGGDLAVNRFGFGAMRITGEGIWGEPADREECKRELRRAVASRLNTTKNAVSNIPRGKERLLTARPPSSPAGPRHAPQGGLSPTRPGAWHPPRAP